MGLLITIIIGVLIGAIASYLMKSESGIIWDMIFGLVGSWLARVLLNVPAGDWSIMGIVWGVIGACAVIFLFRLVTKNIRY